MEKVSEEKYQAGTLGKTIPTSQLFWCFTQMAKLLRAKPFEASIVSNSFAPNSLAFNIPEQLPELKLIN
jgi:hypothetical protein